MVAGQIPANWGKSRPTGANPGVSTTELGQIPAALMITSYIKIHMDSSWLLLRVHFAPAFVGAGISTIPVSFALVVLRRDRICVVYALYMFSVCIAYVSYMFRICFV